MLFREEDAGQAKAPVAARRAMELNPETRVTAIVGDVRSNLGLGAVYEADVILGALDNRDARLFLNECCWKTGTPWVDGAIEGMMGEIRVFLPPHGADYAATLSQQDREGLERRRACTLLPPEKPGDPRNGRVPTTATTSSVVAGIQVQEAVKLLHREEEGYDFGGKGFVFNGMTHDSYMVEYSAGKSDPPPSYDFGGAIEFPSDSTLAELFKAAGEIIDGEVQLVLERDLVLSMTCSRCEMTEDVRQPAKALPDSALGCPQCGRQRRLYLLHRISAEQEDLLTMTPTELGLPPRDVITATNGNSSRVFLLAPDSDVDTSSEQ